MHAVLGATGFVLGHVDTMQAAGTNPGKHFVAPHSEQLRNPRDSKRPVGWDGNAYRCSQRRG